jgi:hypothetical protein
MALFYTIENVAHWDENSKSDFADVTTCNTQHGNSVTINFILPTINLILETEEAIIENQTL